MGDFIGKKHELGGVRIMIDRRSLLKLSGAGLASLLLNSAVPFPAEGGGTRLAMLYDASRCVGCRACQMSCKR